MLTCIADKMLAIMIGRAAANKMLAPEFHSLTFNNRNLIKFG